MQEQKFSIRVFFTNYFLIDPITIYCENFNDATEKNDFLFFRSEKKVLPMDKDSSKNTHPTSTLLPCLPQSILTKERRQPSKTRQDKKGYERNLHVRQKGRTRKKNIFIIM